MASAKSLLGYYVLFVVLWSAVEAIPSQPARGTLKTIHSEDGEVIDCVDIYQQPAFDHPLLKNETSKIPEYLKRFNTLRKNTETEYCPYATVPIKRADPRSDEELRSFRKMKKRYFPTITPPSSGNDHESVSMAVAPGQYYGMKAGLNVWKPSVEKSYEFSLAHVSLFTGGINDENFCSVEAGWQVYPDRYNNDTEPRLFVFWTSDNFETTGCYDLDCNGFILTGNDPRYWPGSVLKPVSIYNSSQYEISIAIRKYRFTGDWFLLVNDYAVGYWPAILLNGLGVSADGARVGGEIVNAQPGGRHTKTQMGSGHKAQNGFRKAAFVRDIKVISDLPYFSWVDPSSLNPEVTDPNCYSLEYFAKPPFLGNGFFYGGNGYSNACP